MMKQRGGAYRKSGLRPFENCRKYTDDEKVLEFIAWLDTVHEDFIGAAFDAIDEEYGGMDSFLRNEMSLDGAKLERLKKLYLE